MLFLLHSFPLYRMPTYFPPNVPKPLSPSCPSLTLLLPLPQFLSSQIPRLPRPLPQPPDCLEVPEELAVLFNFTHTVCLGTLQPLAGLHRSRKASSGSSSRGAAMEEQVSLMCEQLQLARRLHHPIALHCVQAYGHMLTALQQHGPFTAGVILHSFNGPPDMIPALISLNAFFSFSRLSASSPPHKLAHLLHQVPLDRLLLETDSPDGLPPSRRKGKEGSTGRGGGEDGKAGEGWG
ncbi:unnamed protein product [Closterium sp. Yama58-4]|nr:unnamed protein product [Closterium sp. Yama58-4]